MGAGANLVELRERCYLAQLGDVADTHRRRPDVIDELVLNQLPAIVNGVEDLSDGNVSPCADG